MRENERDGRRTGTRAQGGAGAQQDAQEPGRQIRRPNEVHKLRTASRRVEAIAAALAQVESKESRRSLKSIEPIRKAAGGVREMDVLLANARRLARTSAGDSLTRLVEHLQIARQQNAVELRRAIGKRRDAARENLKEYIRLVRAESARAKSSTSANGSAENDGIHAAALYLVIV